MDSLIDVVVSESINPLMSGVARFNHQLARRLGVPYLPWTEMRRWRHPLISGKPAAWPEPVTRDDDYHQVDLFIHEWPTAGPALTRAQQYIHQARRVFAANGQIASAVRPFRPDVREAHCPGLIESSGRLPTVDLSIFSFGMGHKLRVDCYRRLHALLETTGLSFCLFMSVGLHEDAPCPDNPFFELVALFRPAVIFLGVLTDRAIAHWLATATYVAQFFSHGLRANNTTVNAALTAGATVVTNCDEWTPPILRAAVLDVGTASQLTPISLEAKQAAAAAMSWETLLARLKSPGSTAQSAQTVCRGVLE